MSSSSDVTSSTITSSLPSFPFPSSSSLFCPFSSCSRYDRQVRLWGEDGQLLLRRSRVCVVGSSALGAELAKNLVLPGIGEVVLIDDQRVTNRDYGSNYFVNQDEENNTDKEKEEEQKEGSCHVDEKGNKEINKGGYSASSSSSSSSSCVHGLSDNQGGRSRVDCVAKNVGKLNRDVRCVGVGVNFQHILAEAWRGARPYLQPGNRSDEDKGQARLLRTKEVDDVTTCQQSGISSSSSFLFLCSFDVIALTISLLPSVLDQLVQFLLLFAPLTHLLVLRVAGMFGSVRVTAPLHLLLDNRSNPGQWDDLRITNPFPELLALAHQSEKAAEQGSRQKPQEKVESGPTIITNASQPYERNGESSTNHEPYLLTLVRAVHQTHRMVAARGHPTVGPEEILSNDGYSHENCTSDTTKECTKETWERSWGFPCSLSSSTNNTLTRSEARKFCMEYIQSRNPYGTEALGKAYLCFRSCRIPPHVLRLLHLAECHIQLCKGIDRTSPLYRPNTLDTTAPTSPSLVSSCTSTTMSFSSRNIDEQCLLPSFVCWVPPTLLQKTTTLPRCNSPKCYACFFSLSSTFPTPSRSSSVSSYTLTRLYLPISSSLSPLILCLKALARFVRHGPLGGVVLPGKTDAVLPVSGLLPDMEGSSAAYAQLLGEFRKRAALDRGEVKALARKVLEEEGIELENDKVWWMSEVDWWIDHVCKVASKCEFFSTTEKNEEEEEENPIGPMDQRKRTREEREESILPGNIPNEPHDSKRGQLQGDSPGGNHGTAAADASPEEEDNADRQLLAMYAVHEALLHIYEQVKGTGEEVRAKCESFTHTQLDSFIRNFNPTLEFLTKITSFFRKSVKSTSSSCFPLANISTSSPPVSCPPVSCPPPPSPDSSFPSPGLLWLIRSWSDGVFGVSPPFSRAALLCRTATLELQAVAAFVAGVGAQECVKLLCKKFKPINNVFLWDARTARGCTLHV